MLNINVTITNRPKSQLKQKVKILWAVFDLAMGRFAHIENLWAVLVGSVLVHGPFWYRPVETYAPQCGLEIRSQTCHSQVRRIQQGPQPFCNITADIKWKYCTASKIKVLIV